MSATDSKKVIIRRMIFIIITIIVLSFPVWLTTHIMTIKNFETSDMLQLLSSLFVISLFLERALDVFLTTWRARESELLDNEIKSIEIRLKSAKTDQQRESINSELKNKKVDKINHVSKTRIAALWWALILGIIISSLGFRALRFLISPISFAGLEGMPLYLFNMMDVFITGGLLAGGSDGIHKLMNLYRAFTEESAALRRKRGETERQKLNTE